MGRNYQVAGRKIKHIILMLINVRLEKRKFNVTKVLTIAEDMEEKSETALSLNVKNNAGSKSI